MHDYGYDEDGRPVGKIILISLLVVAGLVGLYFLGWFLKEQAVNRTSQINNDSYARQSALVEEIIDTHSQVTDLDVRVAGDVTAEQKTLILTQRAALVTELCAAHGQVVHINNIPANIHSFATQECN
jgi:hypothetical protein